MIARASILLAELETRNTDLNTITTNTPIEHDSFVEDYILETDFFKSLDPSQVGVAEINVFETSFAKSSVSKDCPSKIDVFKANLPEHSVAEVAPFHETILETAFIHTDSMEIGKAQVNSVEMTPIEVGFAKVGFGVNTSSKDFISKISSHKTLPSEILFSPSVESEQFFSIHNSSPQIINNRSKTNKLALSLITENWESPHQIWCSSKTNKLDLSLITVNTSIGHDSFVEDNILTAFDNQFSSPPQVGITEIGIEETSFLKNGVPKYGSTEIDFCESNLSKSSVAKISPFHITVPKTTFVHTNSTEIGEAQINLPEMTPIEVGFAKVGFGVNTSSEDFVSKISSHKTLPSEILFYPSVESEQFFSIHNSSPQIINNRSKTNKLALSPITTNTAIGHDSFVEDHIIETDFIKPLSITQVGVTEVGFVETEFTQSSVSKNRFSKIDLAESNLPENGVAEVTPFHVAILGENTLINSRSTEISETQISFPERSPIEVGFTKVGFGVNTSSEDFVSKISSHKTLPSEISFSPSVESEQFFSIHNSTPESFYTINNSALTLWNSSVTLPSMLQLVMLGFTLFNYRRLAIALNRVWASCPLV